MFEKYIYEELFTIKHPSNNNDVKEEIYRRNVAKDLEDKNDDEIFRMIEVDRSYNRHALDAIKKSKGSTLRNHMKLARYDGLILELYRRNMRKLGVTSLPINFVDLSEREDHLIEEISILYRDIQGSEEYLHKRINKIIEDDVDKEVEETLGPIKQEEIDSDRREISENREKIKKLVEEIILDRIKNAGYNDPKEAIKDKDFIANLNAIFSCVIYNFTHSLEAFIKEIEG
jgi:hypothetical protein